MGFLNWEESVGVRKSIRRRLAKRGLEMDLSCEWEVHGPHKGMNYRVYVGYAYEGDIENSFCVALYPRAVYAIQKPSDWHKPDPDNRIYCLKFD